MIYRRLAETGLNLSLIGFGAAPLGDVFGTVDPIEAKNAVHLAIDRGINFFDVSPYYGNTVAERRLGEALSGKREKVVLSTKCGRYGKSDFDFSARRISASVEESLKRLRTDYVDLLLAHDIEFGDLQQIFHETIPAMRKLQEQGKARYIGISGYPLRTLAYVIEQVPLDAVLSYCHYNLMIRDMDDVLTPMAKQRGIGLINAACLHMGILTARGPSDWHPAPKEVREAGRKAVEHCHAQGVDIAELALGFCVGHSYVSSTLVGISSRSELEGNLKLFEDPADRTELLKEVHEILAPFFNYAWSSGQAQNN